MATLLVVHHTVSPATHAVASAVVDGASDARIEGVRVVVRAALAATATDALDADGYLVGGPANLGYLAGAVKHFFDQIYYPCLDLTVGRPFGAWLHGTGDVGGAERGLEVITTGLRWRRAQPTLVVLDRPDPAALEAAWELGAAVAAGLAAA